MNNNNNLRLISNQVTLAQIQDKVRSLKDLAKVEIHFDSAQRGVFVVHWNNMTVPISYDLELFMSISI